MVTFFKKNILFRFLENPAFSLPHWFGNSNVISFDIPKKIISTREQILVKFIHDQYNLQTVYHMSCYSTESNSPNSDHVHTVRIESWGVAVPFRGVAVVCPIVSCWNPIHSRSTNAGKPGYFWSRSYSEDRAVGRGNPLSGRGCRVSDRFLLEPNSFTIN